MYLRLCLFLFGLIPGLAFAQANVFDPVPNDKALMVLGSLFGGLKVFGSSGADPFGAGIALFNSCVLTIGGILVAYTVIIGTIGTAHDGEMLGKKFSSAWVPIRTALGTALVLPVISNTYCVMQGIVGWLIVQGIGLADQVWKKYTEASSINAIAGAGLQSPNAKDFGYKAFQTLACYRAIEAAIALNSSEDAKLAIPDDMSVAITKSTNALTRRETWAYGVSPDRGGFTPNSCGTISFSTIGTGGANLVKESSGLLSTLSVSEVAAAMARAQAITTAQATATKDLINTLDGIASNMVSTLKPIEPSTIDAAISTFEGAIRSKAASEIQGLSVFEKLGENAAADGFLMAGAYYTKMSYMIDLVQRSIDITSEATGPQGMDNPLFADMMSRYDSVLTKSLSRTLSAPSSGFKIMSDSTDSDPWSLSAILKKVFAFEQWVMSDKEHPLMAMKRMGSWLMTIASGALVTVFGLTIGAGTVVGKVVGVVTGITSAPVIGFIQTLTFIVIIPLLLTGITLAYVLPMMPFFLWFGAVLGWLVMCVEAIIAAPMWAVMHLSPHGDDLVGTGSQGYRLVLGLVLRPVLMIFGLIAALILLTVVGQVLEEVFFGAFASSQSDTSIFGLIIGFFIAPVLYSVSLYILIKKLFSMIHVIPDEMLKWFGGGGQQLGDFAQTIGGEKAASYQALGAIVNTSGNALRDGVSSANRSSMEGKMNLKNEEKAANDLQLKSTQAHAERDKSFGSGAGDFISQNGGGSPLAESQIENSLSNAVSQFPKGSPEREQFMSKLGELSSNNTSGQTSSDMISQASNHVLDSKFGSAASSVVGNIGAVGTPDFNRAVSGLNNKFNNLVKGGMSESDAGAKIDGMLQAVQTRYDNGDEGGNIKKILSQESSNLNIPQPPMVQAADKAAPAGGVDRA